MQHITVYIALGVTFWNYGLCIESGGCQTLDGVWYNQLGSEMILNHTVTGQLYGEYRTAVESDEGAAGYTHSMVIGASPYNTPGAIVGFAVMFNRGRSITAWTGQCLVTDGEEVLVSSWLLRSQVFSCVDKWKSTRIGQDMFTRHEQTLGPRKEDGTSSPGTYGKMKNSIATFANSELRVPRSVDLPCVLEGIWYNELGSEIILHHHPNNTITGEYRTAVERSQGAAGMTHSLVYGLGNVYSAETTFALFVVWNNGASVTGWVGQCHVCGEKRTEKLEVNWLLRSQVDSSDDNWKATSYGQNSFTRHEQKEGPRKHLGIHTPQQEGEYEVIQSKQAIVTCSASQVNVSIFLVLMIGLFSIRWQF